MAASAAFALKPGVWFRRGRLLIVSPDSLGTACPLSGRNSTYRPVQILEAGSLLPLREAFGPTIPPRCNRNDPVCFSPHLYRARNLVERFFNKIKQCRRGATRYDQLAANYLAFIQLASIRLWLRIMSPHPSRRAIASFSHINAGAFPADQRMQRPHISVGG